MNKQNILKKLSIALTAIAILTWFGCAAKTNVSSIRPAEVSMGGIRTLAILKFDGRFGESVRSDFYSKLSEVPHFKLIDTTMINSLDKVIYDQPKVFACP